MARKIGKFGLSNTKGEVLWMNLFSSMNWLQKKMWSDTIETLDFDKMTEVINSSYNAIIKII